MVARSSKRLFAYVAASLATLFVVGIPTARAQHGSEGTVTVTVIDASGSVVQGAQLELRDLTTNDLHTAETQAGGTYTFANLSLGKYQLKVTKTGFQTQVYSDVVVQAAQTTDIKTNLKVGAINETVEVSGGTAPVVETTTNAIGTTVDMRQIEDLPLQGRDLTALAHLVPGYEGYQPGNGTFDGLPSIAQGNNIDGVIGSPSRMKFGGNDQAIVSPRVEAIEEMTVQSEQLNLDQGYGQANMQLNFVTRHGTNAFHGRIYDDFQNSGLNANSWQNDAITALDPANPARKNLLHINDFGASLGGAILKDKLFFFGSYAERRIPGAYSTSNNLFTAAAQAGNFTYNGQTVNLFTLAQNYNTAHGTNLPTAVLNCSASYCPSSVLSAVNSSTSAGQVTPSQTGDPNLNQVNWQVNNPQVSYFPAVRVDYIATQKMRLNLAWNMTKDNFAGANPPDFPGSAFANTGAGNRDTSYTLAFGFTQTLSPTMVNDVRGGFLYNVNLGAYNAPALDINNPQLGWNYPNVPYPQGSQMSGTVFYSGINTEYPVFTASDTMTWQHGAHTMNYGISWWREQNHYYNPVAGYPVVNFGLANGDPAVTALTNGLPGASSGGSGQLTEAEQLYAILTGRISSVQGGGGGYPFITSANDYVHELGRYNLDELTWGTGLFFQDSYRIKPNFTLNYGLRWDFTSADKDLSKLYHSASPAAIFGPSGVGNLFNPGAFTSDPNGLNPTITQNPNPYNSWKKAFQPAIGFAWNPSSNSRIGRMVGGERTVVRGGFSLRNFTEPQQYVWNQASDYGSFYYQSFFLNANTSGATGSFAPGSLAISDFNPSATDPTQAFTGLTYGVSPATFQATEAASDFTFQGGPGLNGMNPHIQQPYTESWNFGIQRQLGESRALEVRYVGSHTARQWLNINPNEINIFGTTSQFPNSFLTQFKNAQTNLQINQANGITSFADNGYTGQQPTPIFDAAFAGEASGGTGVPLSDYGFGGFITDLQTGQAGAMANTLAGIGGPVLYFCNLVGAGFGPCANVGYTGAGAGYPINYFQANPYSQAIGSSYTEAEGYSNYNALQLDFRQRAWHGLQFDANYTWSHTLGVATQNNWQGQGAVFTVRDMRLSYGPTLFDLRHVMHVNGTYDLPFGRGKQFANHGGALDRIIGGWTVGTIFTFQTGAPFLLLGGTNTFNDYGDGGVILNGVTPAQLQSSVGRYSIPGRTNVAVINPKYLASATGGGANPTYISSNNIPGTFGQRVWLHGPHNTFDDVSISKHFPITERFRFTLQAEMLNAFNHPTFSTGATNGGVNFGFNSINSGGFGIVGSPLDIYPGPSNIGLSANGGARQIELRANFEF